METSTARLLDVIDEFLSAGGRPASELWNVLSALRGPDSGDEEEKMVATIPIRRRALPKTTLAYRKGDICFGPSLSGGDTLRFERLREQHFADHVFLAARTLGMLPASAGFWDVWKRGSQ